MMNIKIQRGSNLGQVHQNLGIGADARISVSELYGNQQLDVWDLSNCNYFKISGAMNPPVIEKKLVPVPEWVMTIIEAPSNELLGEREATWRGG